jgi:hypothetical protein
MQGSSQGILACRAGTRAPPASMHETKKNKKLKKISLQNMKKCIAIHFCFPVFDTSLKISPETAVVVVATCFLARWTYRSMIFS